MSPRRRPRRRIDDDVAERVADTMFALSTPSRVQILCYLLDGPSAVAELTETLELAQSSVSHQLRLLRDHALVRVEKVGRQRVYGLYDEHVAELVEGALQHVERRGGERARLRARRAG